MMGGTNTCSDTELATVFQLLLAASYDNATASSVASGICSNFTVSVLTPMGAVLSWTLAKTDENVAEMRATAYGLDTLFCLMSAYLIFCMQMGFALYAAGIVRARNISAILMKNFFGLCISAISFYLVGYAFEFGSPGKNNGFIGYGNFALSDMSMATEVPHVTLPYGQGWQVFMFNWGFCAAATSILSGSVAERATLTSYLIYSALFTLWVYPVIAHWHWSPYGWISAYNPNPLLGIGVIDFAGSGVVHTLGGFSALCAAILLGPRMGRYDPMTDQRAFTVAPNPSLYLLGSLLLWFGWYGFNPGSLLSISDAGNAATVGRTAVNTTLSSATGALATLLLFHWRTKTFNLLATATGSLAGLVAITSGCAVVQPWAAVSCGIIAAPVLVYSEALMEFLQVDDPVSAFPLHGMCGLWGMIFVGFFADEAFLNQVYGAPTGHSLMGLFYGGHGQLLLCEIIAMLAIIGWVLLWIGGLFVILKHLGLLRVSMEVEAEGFDLAQMGVKSERGGAGRASATCVKAVLATKAPRPPPPFTLASSFKGIAGFTMPGSSSEMGHHNALLEPYETSKSGNLSHHSSRDIDLATIAEDRSLRGTSNEPSPLSTST